MQRLLLVMIMVFLFLFCIESNAQKYDTNLIPYRQGDKWGYCDKSKKIVILPRFKEVSLFQGPITFATSFDSGHCVINQKGEILYSTKNSLIVLADGKHFIPGNKFDTEQVFDAYLKPVTKKYYSIMSTEYNYWSTYAFYKDLGLDRGYTPEGLLDSTFKEVLPPMQGRVVFLTRDLVKLVDDDVNKRGLMNLKTKKRYAIGYEDICAPRENMMMVKKDGLYGFIDMNGTLVIPAKFEQETPELIKKEDAPKSDYKGYNIDGFYEGLAVVLEGSKAGYIDKAGKTVIPFEFDKAYGFIGGYAWVQKNGKWGMINKQGKYILQPLYRSPAMTWDKWVCYLEGFHDGLVALSIDSLFGYFDVTGRMVIPFSYSKAEPFYKGMAIAYQGDKIGFINKKGEWVIKPQYKSVGGLDDLNTDPFQHGCTVVQEEDGRWSIIDKKGNIMIPLKFDKSNDIWFEDNIAEATADGKRYIFNNKGKILYAFDSDSRIGRITSDLFYNSHDKYYFNPKTKMKYYD